MMKQHYKKYKKLWNWLIWMDQELLITLNLLQHLWIEEKQCKQKN